ncbi:MAG: diguanylate cyclase [Pararhodobacter sp.]
MAAKILIVDDLAINRIILKVKLSAACHESLQAADGLTALELAQRERPTLILLDMMLPDISGIEVCRRLRANPATRDIPVIIVTALSDRERRLEALAAGADDFLSKPLNEAILLARIRSLLRARETEAELRLRATTCRDLGFSEADAEFAMPARIGLIAPEHGIALAWREALAPLMAARFDLLTPSEALSDAGDGPAPDVYLVAADLGRSGAGLALVSDLRARLRSRHAAIMLIMPQAASETAAMALDLGANDMMMLPFDAQETALRLNMQVRRKRRADLLRRQISDGLQLAITDPLTGLYNRRYALAHLERIAARAGETGKPYAVMVLDLDRFKAINDRYGHGAGDTVLEVVADRLRTHLRPSDLVARIGGEEFLVILPEASLATAQIAAERLCGVVGETPIALPKGLGAVNVTISAGLALGDGDEHPAETAQDASPGQAVLDRADAALMRAKAAGRNRVTVSASAA